MKTRADSLYAKLKPALREDLLHGMIVMGRGISWAVGVCKKAGVSTTDTSMSRFLQRHGLGWRLERAAALAKSTEKSLPKNWEAEKKRGLAQKEFELAFSNLTVGQWFLLKRAELQEAKNEIDSRKVTILEKKLAAAKEVVEDSKLSPQERQQRMKEIFGIQ